MDSAAPLPPVIIDLSAANSVERLAIALGVDLELFQLCRSHAFYIQHRIPKRSRHRSGEYRVVWEAPGIVAQLHKSISRRLENYLRGKIRGFPSDASYGYVRGRSTRDNAKRHCGAKLLLRADIENFFPAISEQRLATAFVDAGIPRIASDALASFVTIDGQLAIGLHASPMLANLACLSLDEKFAALAAKYECVYTRYADDLTFSGLVKLPTKKEVSEILEGEGFALSERKFKISKRGQAHYVTGLSVSEPTPHAPRLMKRRLRQELYYASRFGVVEHLERIGEEIAQRGVNRLDGTVNYVSGIEKSNGEHLRQLWISTMQECGAHPTYLSRPTNNRDIFAFVDETELTINGTTYLAISLVRCEERDRLVKAIEEIKHDYLADPFAKGGKAPIAELGLHYTDSHPDLRKAFFDTLPTLPFSACISFQAIGSPPDYGRVYRQIFSRLLRQAFMTSDGATLTIMIEQNSKVSITRLNKDSHDLFEQLRIQESRRPCRVPTITSVSKSKEPCISVPDFLLASFRAYAAAHTRAGTDAQRYLEFERVRDKIRYIEDGDAGVFYTRKRPFQPL